MTTLPTFTLSKQTGGIGDNCPFCQSPLQFGEVAVRCPGTCTRFYHSACWTSNNNKCATLGCNGSSLTPGTAPILEPLATNQATWEPEILSQSSSVTNTLDSPTPSGTSSLDININPRAAVYVSLLGSLILTYFIDWPLGIGIAALVVSLIVLLAETSLNGSFSGAAPQVNVASAAVFGILTVTLSEQMWPFLWEYAPGINRYIPIITAILAGIFTHIGGWGSSQTLSPDNSGLVRGITSLALIYAATTWSLNEYELWATVIIVSTIAVVLVVLGFWSGQLTLGPRRVAGSFAGALTMTGIVAGIYTVLFDYAYIRYIPFGQSILSLPITPRVLLTLAAAYGSSESGSKFTFGLYRFLLNLLLAGTLLGIVVIGGYLGFNIAGEAFADRNLAFVGAVVGGAAGLIVAVLLQRFVRSLSA